MQQTVPNILSVVCELLTTWVWHVEDILLQTVSCIYTQIFWYRAHILNTTFDHPDNISVHGLSQATSSDA